MTTLSIIGAFAFGSLIEDPGIELRSATLETIRGIETPAFHLFRYLIRSWENEVLL